MQEIMEKVALEAKHMGMRVDPEKTEVQLVGREAGVVKAEVRGVQLKQVHNFMYL